MLRTASDLRQFALKSLTRKKPELLDLTIQQLRELADDTDRLVEDCGPFDPATEHMIELSQFYHRLAFLKDAEARNLDRGREVAVARFVPALGSNILGMSAEEAMNLAEHYEEAANNAGLLTPKGRQLSRRVSSYIDLAVVLESFENIQSAA